MANSRQFDILPTFRIHQHPWNTNDDTGDNCLHNLSRWKLKYIVNLLIVVIPFSIVNTLISEAIDGFQAIWTSIQKPLFSVRWGFTTESFHFS